MGKDTTRQLSMYELIYTSAQRGLRPGVSGFCSVAWTRGAPAEQISLVEKLSAYKLLIPAHSPEASRNPVNFRFLRLRVGTRPLLIVSRIAFAGFDYTNRSNILAHHLFFDQPEEFAALPGGAAAICLAKKNFVTTWEGEPRLLEPRAPATVPLPSDTNTWKRLAGDSNWGYLVAENYLRHDRASLDIEYHWRTADSQTLLQLVAEAAALLSSSDLPGFTFSTYYTQAATNAECFLRLCPNESETTTSQRLRSTFCAALIQPAPCPQVNFPLVRSVQAPPAIPKKAETDDGTTKENSSTTISLRPYPATRVTPLTVRPQNSAREGKHAASPLQIPSSQTERHRLRLVLLLVVLVGGLAGVLVALQAGRGSKPHNTPRPPAPPVVEPATAQPATPPTPSPSAHPDAIEKTPIAQEEMPQKTPQPSLQPMEAMPPPGHLELTSDNELFYQPSPQETPYLDRLTVLGPGGQPLSELSSQWQKQWQNVQKADTDFHQSTERIHEKKLENENILGEIAVAKNRVQVALKQLGQQREAVLQQLKKQAEQITQTEFEQDFERFKKSWTPSDQPGRAGGLPTGDVRRQECNADLLKKKKQWDKVLREYAQDAQKVRSRICQGLYTAIKQSTDYSQLSLENVRQNAKKPVQDHLKLLENVVRTAPNVEQREQLRRVYENLLNYDTGILVQFHQLIRTYRQEVTKMAQLKNSQEELVKALETLRVKATDAKQNLQAETTALRQLVNDLLPTEHPLPVSQTSPDEIRKHLATHLDSIQIRRNISTTEGHPL